MVSGQYEPASLMLSYLFEKLTTPVSENLLYALCRKAAFFDQMTQLFPFSDERKSHIGAYRFHKEGIRSGILPITMIEMGNYDGLVTNLSDSLTKMQQDHGIQTAGYSQNPATLPQPVSVNEKRKVLQEPFAYGGRDSVHFSPCSTQQALEPAEGFEPTTYSLRMSCSAD